METLNKELPLNFKPSRTIGEEQEVPLHFKKTRLIGREPIQYEPPKTNVLEVVGDTLKGAGQDLWEQGIKPLGEHAVGLAEGASQTATGLIGFPISVAYAGALKHYYGPQMTWRDVEKQVEKLHGIIPPPHTKQGRFYTESMGSPFVLIGMARQGFQKIVGGSDANDQAAAGFMFDAILLGLGPKAHSSIKGYVKRSIRKNKPIMAGDLKRIVAEIKDFPKEVKANLNQVPDGVVVQSADFQTALKGTAIQEKARIDTTVAKTTETKPQQDLPGQRAMRAQKQGVKVTYEYADGTKRVEGGKPTQEPVVDIPRKLEPSKPLDKGMPKISFDKNVPNRYKRKTIQAVQELMAVEGISADKFGSKISVKFITPSVMEKMWGDATQTAIVDIKPWKHDKPTSSTIFINKKGYDKIGRVDLVHELAHITGAGELDALRVEGRVYPRSIEGIFKRSEEPVSKTEWRVLEKDIQAKERAKAEKLKPSTVLEPTKVEPTIEPVKPSGKTKRVGLDSLTPEQQQAAQQISVRPPFQQPQPTPKPPVIPPEQIVAAEQIPITGRQIQPTKPLPIDKGMSQNIARQSNNFTDFKKRIRTEGGKEYTIADANRVAKSQGYKNLRDFYDKAILEETKYITDKELKTIDESKLDVEGFPPEKKKVYSETEGVIPKSETQRQQLIDDFLVKAEQEQKKVEKISSEKGVKADIKSQHGDVTEYTLEKPEGKIKAGGLRYGDDLPKYAESINLERMGIEYGAKRVVLDIAERYQGAIEKKTRGKVTWEQTKEMADSLGLTTEELMTVVKRKTKHLDAYVHAARDTLATTSTKAYEANKTWRENPTPENWAKASEANLQSLAIQMEVSGVASESARALNIHKKLSQVKQHIASSRYQEAIKIAGKYGLTEVKMRLIALTDFENPMAVAKLMRQLAPAKRLDKIYAIWMNFLLSGPQTHVVNTIGNTFMALDKVAMTGVAAGLESLRPLMGRKKSVYFGEVHATAGSVMPGTAYLNKVNKAAQQYGFEITSGLETGVRRMLEVWNNELLARETISKIEKHTPFAMQIRAGKAKAPTPSGSLVLADEFVKGIMYTMDLHGQAYRISKARGLKGDALYRDIAKLLNEPTEKMIEHATLDALRRTFQAKPGKFGEVFMKLRNVPGFKWVLPFVRVAINIPKEALRRSPAQAIRLLDEGIRSKKGRGRMTQAEFAEETALGLMGTATAIMVGNWVMKGNITGGEPMDPGEREAYRREGKQPYSVRIPKAVKDIAIAMVKKHPVLTPILRDIMTSDWLSYERFEPMGTMMGIMGDYVQISQKVKAGDQEKLVSQIINVFREHLIDKTFLRGLHDASEAFADPVNKADRFLKGFIGSFVPRAVASAARAIDPVVRDTRGFIDYLKYQIPVLSKTVPPRVDIHGKEEKRSGTSLYRMFSPFYTAKERMNIVDTELNRLKIYPSKPSRDVTLAWEEKRRKLSGKDYSKMQKEIGGPLFTALSGLISSEEYSKLTEYEKKVRIKGMISGVRTYGRIPYRFRQE